LLDEWTVDVPKKLPYGTFTSGRQWQPRTTDPSVDYLRYYWCEPTGFNHDIIVSANLSRNMRY
jgi:hypothetical protein